MSKLEVISFNKQIFHAVSLSGGKDSTAMLLLMIERGLPINTVLWADTGMEFPEMYDHKFKKLIQAYEKAEQSGYYEVAGAEPHSVIVLKQPFGDIPAGKKLLWVCGDRGFHCAAGVFGGELKCSGRLRVIPVEAVLNGTDDPRMEGLDFDSPAPSENAYMKRYSVANYAHRMRAGLAR